MMEAQAYQSNELCLIHPPITPSRLRESYSSLPVLSGFLDQHGYDCKQIELNWMFGEFLVTDETLEWFESGDSQFLPGQIEPLVRVLRKLYKKHGIISTRARIESDNIFAHDLLVNFGYQFRFTMDCARAIDLVFESDTAENDVDGSAAFKAIFQRFLARSDIRSIVGTNNALVGISVSMDDKIYPSLILAEWIKSINPTARVVLGGAGMSLASEEQFERLFRKGEVVDAVVRYDGEFPLLALVEQALAGDWNPGKVAGVVAPTQSGGIVARPPKPGPSVHDLPAPVYDPLILKKCDQSWISITQARGCYWGKCSYCDYVKVYEGSPAYRALRVHKFVDEMKSQIARYEHRFFHIQTDALPPSFARKMSEEIIAERLNVRWYSFVMVDPMYTEELMRLMVQSGCHSVTVGMESMSDRALELVRKRATRADNLAFLENARKSGLRVRLSMIPDLPGTSFEEAMQGLEDIKQFEEIYDVLTPFEFVLSKTSDMGRDPSAYGLEISSDHPHPQQNRYSFRANDMTDAERTEVFDAYDTFRERIRIRSLREARKRRVARTACEAPKAVTAAQRPA